VIILVACILMVGRQPGRKLQGNWELAGALAAGAL